jgi:adenylate cyclase 8
VLFAAPKDAQTSTAVEEPPVEVDGGHLFKRGIVYRGVYCPSLSNSFRELHLELAYQRYSHRQRQKSLIIVNLVDALLKIVLAVVRKQSTALTSTKSKLDVTTSNHLCHLIHNGVKCSCVLSV